MHYMRDLTFRREHGLSDGEKIIGSHLAEYQRRMDAPNARPQGGTTAAPRRISRAVEEAVARVREPSSIRAAMRVAEVLRPFGRRDRKRIVAAVLAELQ